MQVGRISGPDRIVPEINSAHNVATRWYFTISSKYTKGRSRLSSNVLPRRNHFCLFQFAHQLKQLLSKQYLAIIHAWRRTQKFHSYKAKPGAIALLVSSSGHGVLKVPALWITNSSPGLGLGFKQLEHMS